jgi:hypothetical protein
MERAEARQKQLAFEGTRGWLRRTSYVGSADTVKMLVFGFLNFRLLGVGCICVRIPNHNEKMKICQRFNRGTNIIERMKQFDTILRLMLPDIQKSLSKTAL